MSIREIVACTLMELEVSALETIEILTRPQHAAKGRNAWRKLDAN